MGELDDRWQRNFEASQKRLRLKEQAVAFLGGECAICGYSKCPAAFDFHHPDSSSKDFSISEKSSWDATFEAELRKCVLLCTNCHREVHAGWHPRYLLDDSHNGPDDDWAPSGINPTEASLDCGTQSQPEAQAAEEPGVFAGVLAAAPPGLFRPPRS